MADDFTATNPVAAGYLGRKDQYDAVFNNTVALRNRIPRAALRGLMLGVARDGNAASSVTLFAADEITMSDGARLTGWQNLSASLAIAGAGGLDSGAEAASTWYEVHAIAKSSDDTRALLLHKAKGFNIDEAQATSNATISLRASAATNKIAQGFQVDSAAALEYVDLNLQQVGIIAAGSYVWVTVETDNAGSPSGTVVATSDKIPASFIQTTAAAVRFYFRARPTLSTTPTQYHLVVQGDFAVSGVNYIAVAVDTTQPYARGTAKTYDSGTTVWTTQTSDLRFALANESASAALTLPTGYDRSAHIGFAYNDSGSNLTPFFAHNRTVQWPVVSIGTFTVTYPAQTSCATFLPPVPVVGEFWASGNSPGNYVGLSPSHAPTNSVLQGAQAAWVGAGTALGEVPMEIVVEGQLVYAWVSGGTGALFTKGYRW